MNEQTTRGQMLGEKPPEVRTIYAPDGSPHSCSPVDAREILAAGLGYTAEPPAATLTGGGIFGQAYAEIEKKKAEHEQQPEQQPEHGDAAAGAGAETANAGDAKPDNSGVADSGGKTGASSRSKARK